MKVSNKSVLIPFMMYQRCSRPIDGSCAGVLFAALLLFLTLPGGVLLAGSSTRAQQTVEKTRLVLDGLARNRNTAAKAGRLYEKTGDAQRKLKNTAAAQKAYGEAINAYLSRGLRAKYDRLLKRLSRSGRGWPRKITRRFAKLRILFKGLVKLSKKARRLPRRREPGDDMDVELLVMTQKANEMLQAARKWEIPALEARSLEIKAHLLGAAGETDDELKNIIKASDVCSDGACFGMRLRLLARAAKMLEKDSKLMKAYCLYARINAEKTAGMPAERRRYVRSADLIRVCDKIRAAGRGPCHRLEKEAVGFATYRDFSKQRVKGILSKATIAKAHAEYLPLLKECMLQAGRSGEAISGDRYELFWAISNEGHTDRFSCTPPVKGTSLGACLEGALETFRYPRYQGERRTVTVPLAVGR